MSYEKKIVCLANSRKNSGRCIAGKEIVNGHYGQWIRPVSQRESEEISEEERMFKNGDYPQIMDVISITFTQKKQRTHQPENHLIDPDFHWKKQGKIKYKDLSDLKDTPIKLWINGLSSSKGENDRFQITDGSLPLPASLYLIYLDTLKVKVLTDAFNEKRKVRALFQYNKASYNLIVTDPRAEHYFLKKQDGKYTIQSVYLCISIGEEFKGYYYKLVASIIKDPPL